jgi:thiamine pyrophosphokinase
MRALVVANGEPPSARLARESAEGAALVVGADGGTDAALRLGLSVDVATGDLDSISEKACARLGDDRVVPNTDPEHTDLEKAIALAIEKGATEVTVLGAAGGRADHALANLSVLFQFRGRAKVTLVDDQFQVSAVDGLAEFDAVPGTVVSLVALSVCEGVTTTGLRWELSGETLTFSARGVHNEVVSSPVTVALARGDLLLFHGRFVEHHR